MAPMARVRVRWLPRLLAVGVLACVAFGGSLVALGGCSEPEPQVPEPCDVQIVTLTIFAAENINPNDNGNPRPVVVRLYQLQNDVRLLNARYDDVLLHDAEILEGDILKEDEVSVFPNDLVEVSFERIPEASFLAGVALFHNPKGQSWKTFYEFPLPPGEIQCAGRESDAAVDADPRVAFFIDGTRIDNGGQFDETMFPDAQAIRHVNLPKKSAAPESAPPPSGAR